MNHKQFLGLIMSLLHYTASGIMVVWASVFFEQTKTGSEFSNITKNEASWLASIVISPMAPAALLSGYLMTKLSKKTLLLVTTVVEISAWVIIYIGVSVSWLLIGRFINGIASGVGAAVFPVYLSEISSPKLRGLFLSTIVFGLNFGFLFNHILGAFFTWQTCALITIILLLVYFCMLLYLPESYSWFLQNNNVEKAKEAFYSYRGCNLDRTQELNNLLSKNDDDITKNYTKTELLRMFLSKTFLKPLGICVVGMGIMHLCGSKPIIYYSIQIVSEVIPSLGHYESTIIIDIIRIIMSCIGSVLVKKFKVRVLFMVGGVGSALSHFCFAVFYLYANNDANSSQLFSILALVALISFTMFSSIGILPLVWVLIGELFPFNVKRIGSGVIHGVHFFLFFVTIKITPDLLDFLGISGAFTLFGGFTLAGTVVMYFVLPETKNKTLKEIEEMFK